MYKIIILSEAEAFLQRLLFADQSHFIRIRKAIESLKAHPFRGKALRQELKGRYSLRVGIYRIIYKVDKTRVVIYIVEIGHRRDIYQ